MINIKYYVLLLVGIFLALGLGMMIGITLENQNILENQQTQFIRQIEDRFVSLRTETDRLVLELNGIQDQNDQLHDLSSMLLKELVKNKLSGVHVGVITFSQKNSITDLLEFLRFTGASIQSAVTFLPGFSETHDTAVHTVEQPDELMSTVIQELVYSMDYATITPLIQEAEEFMIVSQNKQYKYPVDTIILVGQGSSTLFYDDVVIGHAKDAGIPVVAVEVGEVENSGISEYKAWGISTVDHVESIYGQLALASVLSGHTGNFGFGTDALDLLPSPLFSEVQPVPKQTIETREGESQ